MTDYEQQNYETALEQIRRAAETGATELVLQYLPGELPPALAELTSLRTLKLFFCGQITDLSPLSGLASLQRLDLEPCVQMSDLSPLSGLASLQMLTLAHCEQISDLSPLSGLASLQTLRLSNCGQISDLSPLSGLASLKTLLLWECKQIRDLIPLSGLAALETVRLWECQQISDLSPLSGLASLQTLELLGCVVNIDFTPLLALLPRLSELYLYGSQFIDLPVEICGASPRDNVLGQVLAHYRDLGTKPASDAEIKVLLLGNGGAGKTQLARRLRNLAFDADVPSTHGIQLSHMDCDLDGQAQPIRLNFWDFGGQEIYHGTHSLFLHGTAVFLLLWTPESECAAPYSENGIVMRHRRLHYWLDYLRAFVPPDSPVLLVQSQCDTSAQRKLELPGNPELQGLTVLQTVQVSSKTGLGLDLLRAALKEAVRDCLAKRPPVPIGAGRVRVRTRLREWLAEGRRWIARADFDRLCQEEGGVSDGESLLRFLHHSGVLFYRTGLFGDRIILDQNWALEAVYALFERNRALPLLNNHGRFRRVDLETLVWQQYTREEQQLFLGMMESCGICFRVRKLKHDEWEYIAPELLPECSEAQEQLLAGRLLQLPPDSEVQARYTLLHEGILRNFLSRIGGHAGNAAVYWKYGCWFYEKTTDSRVLIEGLWEDSAAHSGAGSIRLRAWGPRAEQLIEPLLAELRSLPIGRPPDIVQESSRRDSSGHTAAEGAAVPTRTDGIAALQVVEAVHPPAGKPAVYVSYAWGDDTSESARQRDEVVDRLCDALSADWQVVRDKTAMRQGDLISNFIQTITRADRILVVLSDKYLRSPWCMAELNGIYQRSVGDKEDFLRRVVPLSLADAKFRNWRDRVALARHWESEFREMGENVNCLGTADHGLYRAMRDWYNHVGDILSCVADKLQPVGFEAIVSDDFAAVKQMLVRPDLPSNLI